MQFKIFMIAWIVSILAVSIFASTISRNQTRTIDNNPAHFSVVWKGFAPTYSNSTPDYYICINNLLSDSLQMMIDFQIQNFENSSYYFMIDKYGTPPTGWTIGPYYLGNINVDETKTFVYSNLTRAKPSAIPQGRITENVQLVVGAYRDPSYTTLYSEANFSVPFHFIDLTSGAWTTLMYNNFDDGTFQGWSSSYYAEIRTYQQYRSWPCALYAYYYYGPYYVSKTLDTSGPYTEAYLVFAFRPEYSGELMIDLNGQETYHSDQPHASGVWYQVAIRLPPGVTTNVVIRDTPGYYAYFDDFYVVAK